MDIKSKKALLLDMNSTFMFGEDRFGETEDFSVYYKSIGGNLEKDYLNQIIRSAFEYLDIRYPDKKYRNSFPSLEEAIKEVSEIEITDAELKKIVNTFAFHELGQIPEDYIKVLHNLSDKYILGAVIDIWSPKDAWINLFKEMGIICLFKSMSFSSDHGIVKPSPKPFQMVLKELGVSNKEALVIGDSPRRDLGGAKAAEIDCVLVGGRCHPEALSCYDNLLSFYYSL
jgi:HAD superfamily hydrolase (TIGR01549 family)